MHWYNLLIFFLTNFLSQLLQKASRGIPDGKSDEIVTDEMAEDDVAKYNLQGNKKVVYQPYTQRGLYLCFVLCILSNLS